MSFDFFKKLSDAPTHPHPPEDSQSFDIADLYSGPLSDKKEESNSKISLDEKIRQAYFWIVNTAIISPYYDIEYNNTPPQVFTFGDQKSFLTLPSEQSYSSFVLLPLLNLMVRKRCLLVGGPGRGKTATAILLGVLSGYPLKDIKRAIQHGQPQMSISDLLGNPLPKDMVQAEDMDSIRIAWRKWLGMRVKIIDEYNRIPTRTQSALLTVMADNYAEILDQIYECPESAWFLTANDDGGGGTYQVIEALRDRIDIVVKALHFPSRFLGELLTRIEARVKPEEIVPEEIIFSEQEIELINKEILRVKIPYPLRRRIEFFSSQFELCESAADQMEYKTKDTVKLSGLDFSTVVSQETGKDKVKDIGSQTKNGLSVRSLMTILNFVKALAYFRGQKEVCLEDVRQILPFVLHDKLSPNPDSPFFDVQTNAVYRVDRIGWIRKMFDLACREYDNLRLDKEDPLLEIENSLAKGLENVSEQEVRKKLSTIEHSLNELAKGKKLYGHLYEDILKLKYFHQRYSNYLRWLQWKR